MFEEFVSLSTESSLLVIQALATGGLVIFAYYIWRASRNNTIHNALLDIHYIYASKKMGDSVRILWEFYRYPCQQSKEKVKIEFKKILKRNTLQRKKQFESIESSRMLVSQFYLNMADLYFNNILGWHRLFRIKSLFFYYWSDDTLLILPEIIIPLEEASREWTVQQTNKKIIPTRDDMVQQRQYNFFYESKFFYANYHKKIIRKRKIESEKYQ
jgi:hypothetical protein